MASDVQGAKSEHFMSTFGNTVSFSGSENLVFPNCKLQHFLRSSEQIFKSSEEWFDTFQQIQISKLTGSTDHRFMK